MTYTPTMRNLLATCWGEQAGQVSLHTAEPGSGGDNEASGGDPAYARQIPEWSSASDGTVSAEVSFDIPSGTYTWVGIWDDTGTLFLDADELPEPIVVTGQAARTVPVSHTQT